MDQYLRHPYIGKVKRVQTGFSFTTLFFGALVPLFRGDFFHFFVLWALSWLVQLLAISLTGTTAAGDPALAAYWVIYVGWSICVAYFYNQYHRERLITQGYIPMERPIEEIK